MFRQSLLNHKRHYIRAGTAVLTTGVVSAGIIQQYYLRTDIKYRVFNTTTSSSSCEAAAIKVQKDDSNDSNIQIQNKDLIEQYYDEYNKNVLPMFQAMGRARRLIRTVVLMVMDYQLSKCEDYFEQHFLLPSSFKNTTDNNNDSTEITKDEKINEYKYWEKEVEERGKQLEKAQHEYTSQPPNKAAGLEELSSDETEDKKQFMKKKKEREEYQTKKKLQVREAAARLGEAEEKLAQLSSESGVFSRKQITHRKAASRLLELCRENQGVYIKIGQHIANLDYLVPPEYIEALSALFDDAPISDYKDVREVIKEDLGAYPEELFSSFEEKPIASASLAQVHVAYTQNSNRKLAIKVQHRGLRETSTGDIRTLQSVVKIVDQMFEDFNFMWFAEEIAPQLPRELDFLNEGKNAERAASQLRESNLDVIIPEILWEKSSNRVLSMQFEEGFNSTDISQIEKAGLKKKDVARLISSVFNAQIFEHGNIHCDPHPANVLLREHPNKKGKPQIVLVDHGLYKKIDDDFRVVYAELWRSLMLADLKGIKDASEKLGIQETYPLLAAMLTSRPFDETIERSKSNSLEYDNNRMKSKGDKIMIQNYVHRFLKDIFTLLDNVPRQMLLIFKLNDCLRHIDRVLASPTNTLVVAEEGEYTEEGTEYVHKGCLDLDSCVIFTIFDWYEEQTDTNGDKVIEEKDILRRSGLTIVSDDECIILGKTSMNTDAQRNKKRKRSDISIKDEMDIDTKPDSVKRIKKEAEPSMRLKITFRRDFGVVELDEDGHVIDKGDKDFQPSKKWVGRKGGFEFNPFPNL